MQQAMIPKLNLNPSLRYDAFIYPIQADEEDKCVAINGTVGCVQLYPENAGICVDGTFDPEKWEDEKHPEIISFIPNRDGYRRAIVILKRQCARVDLVDLADGCGLAEFETKIRKSV